MIEPKRIKKFYERNIDAFDLAFDLAFALETTRAKRVP